MSEEKAARLAAIRAAKRAQQTAQQQKTEPVTTTTRLLTADEANHTTSTESTSTAPQPAPPQRRRSEPMEEFDEMLPAVAWQSVALMLLAVIIGAFAAVVVLPAWLPGLSSSLLGPNPKAYWYLSRASGFVAYGLLWLSMIFGLLITNKLARVWPGGPTALDLHQHTSLLGLGFGLFHALILLGDHYIGYTLVQVLVPFAASSYKPLAVGVGQLAFYLMALVSVSFYVRRHIGRTAWRMLHMCSFGLFVLALLHGIASGTDSSTWWAQVLSWGSGGSVLFLTIYRVLLSRVATHPTSEKPQGAT